MVNDGYSWEYLEVFHSGVPPKWMVCKGKSQSKMDDLGGGYLPFRKPPYELTTHGSFYAETE